MSCLTPFLGVFDDSVNNLVMAALPGVKEMTVEKVCDTLASLGVLTISDVEFVESKDIGEVLPPIQCRKLIKYFQEIIQAKFFVEFDKKQPDEAFVKAAMNQTCATQRFFINSKRSITEVRKEWPFLLDEKYIILHFEALVGKDALKLFRENLPLKCRKMSL